MFQGRKADQVPILIQVVQVTSAASWVKCDFLMALVGERQDNKYFGSGVELARAVQFISSKPAIHMEYPLLQEMAGFSPPCVLRNASCPFDNSDPHSKSLHGLLFYVWRGCGPVPPSCNVRRISNCYHRSPVLYYSGFHISGLFCMSIDRPGCFQKYSAVCIRPGSSRRWRIVGPTEIYFLNQLWWDLVQAIGESWDDDDKVIS